MLARFPLCLSVATERFNDLLCCERGLTATTIPDDAAAAAPPLCDVVFTCAQRNAHAHIPVSLINAFHGLAKQRNGNGLIKKKEANA